MEKPSPAQKAPAENKISSVSGGHVIMQKFTSATREGVGWGVAPHFSKHPNSFFLDFPIIPTRYHGIFLFLIIIFYGALRQVMPPLLGVSYFYYVA